MIRKHMQGNIVTVHGVAVIPSTAKNLAGK